ncbi:MAG: DEAD/DEAH box helicase [Syntrophobacterales bacterium]|jgi:CRISPR-associated endonuclease/helicase Cas3|nr:DEAD/DEAH box helicase [Syntrophobacterales bacterium]
MKPLAHSARNGRPSQLYGEHVTGVVERTRTNVSEIFPYIDEEKAKSYLNIVTEAAIYHDLGKLAAQNQEVLLEKVKAKRLPIEHRDAGVKYLLGSAFESPSATLVYAHHRPGLPNIKEKMVEVAPFRFASAAADSDMHICGYLNLHKGEINSLDMGNQHLSEMLPKLSSLEYRILTSCLVDADYSDTAGEKLLQPHTRWTERLKKLDVYVRCLQRKADDSQSERNRLRSEFYACCKNASTEQALEYCNSPVGTGKTTAVMAHMLKLAAEHTLRHIFVVIPYTNIITQTVDVLRDALVLDGEHRAEIVAEHHHQADFESIELRHLASTWTAPIIVTTAVQFFETIASNLPSKLRKLHQLSGSGVIIDESHAALPIGLMPAAWRWITELSSQWGCRFCLCSGTSFKLWENPAFKNVHVSPLVTEQLSQGMECFERNRINLNIHEQNVPHFKDLRSFIDFINQHIGSRLVVLNTVRSAACLAKTLKKIGHDVLHLSTALTPNDREIVINKVKRRLDQKTNYPSDWTLVATSCVECGMDFSFHYGFCEMRSLASYLQLGGRISRNGEYKDSSLICFTIAADGLGTNPSFDISRNVFSKQIQSGDLSKLTITDAVSQSFRMECKEMGGLFDKIGKPERQKAFADVAEQFRVIHDDTIMVIASSILSEKLRAGVIISPRELQRNSVNIRRHVLKQLSLEERELPSLATDQYDDFLGYMKNLLL